MQQGIYGSIELDTQTGQWTYTIDNTLSVFDTLIDNSTDTDNFIITVADSEGLSVEQNVVITITGTYDVSNVLTLQNVKNVDLTFDSTLSSFILDEGEKLIQFDIFIDDSASENINSVTGVEFDISNSDSELVGWTSEFSEFKLANTDTGGYIATGYDEVDASNAKVATFYGISQESDDDLSLTLSNITVTMGEQGVVAVDDIIISEII
jgi:VCBS repeat-containing protein